MKKHTFIDDFPWFSCSSWISHPQIPPNFPKPKLDRFDVTWLGFVGAETMASKATMDGEADTAHWTWESSGWICIWDIWLYIHHYKYIYIQCIIYYIYIINDWGWLSPLDFALRNLTRTNLLLQPNATRAVLAPLTRAASRCPIQVFHHLWRAPTDFNTDHGRVNI